MPWQIIHSRDRSLFVRGAESGAPTFTRQPALALRFDTQDQARKWIERNTLSAFGELALLRAAPESDGAASNHRGVAGHYGARAKT